MANVGENLRTLLLATSAVTAIAGQRINQNKAPQRAGEPYVWFQRRTTSDIYACMGDTQGTAPGMVGFDVECCCTDIDDAMRLADAVKTLHRYRGSMGTQTAKAVFVEDHSDDYLPRNDMGDEGPHVCSLNIEIFLPG